MFLRQPMFAPSMVAWGPPQAFEKMKGARRDPVAAYERALAKGVIVVVEKFDDII